MEFGGFRSKIAPWFSKNSQQLSLRLSGFSYREPVMVGVEEFVSIFLLAY